MAAYPIVCEHICKLVQDVKDCVFARRKLHFTHSCKRAYVCTLEMFFITCWYISRGCVHTLVLGNKMHNSIYSLLMCKYMCMHIYALSVTVFIPWHLFLSISTLFAAPPSVALHAFSLLITALISSSRCFPLPASICLSYCTSRPPRPESASLLCLSEWNSPALLVICLMPLDPLQEVNHAGQ